MKSTFLLIAAFVITGSASAQSVEDFTKTLLPVPLNYTVYKSDEPIILDGKDSEKVWAKAPWSEPFSDIEGTGGTKFPYVTRMKMLWDANNLYVFMRLSETNLWAIHQKDDIVFRENVLKLFFDPDNNMHALTEIQINPYNETYYLSLSRPYRDKGVLATGWMPIGARSAVGIIGTINDPSDKDTEWTVEFSLPFKGINAGNKPPVDGSMWRFDTQRTNYDLLVKDGVYSKIDASGKPIPQQNTAWSPPKMNDIPFPERWGYLNFTQSVAGTKAPDFGLPYTEKQRRYLWAAYYAQKDWLKSHGKFAETLKELNVPETGIMIDGKNNQLLQEATPKQFLITITDGSPKKAISINQDGFVAINQ